MRFVCSSTTMRTPTIPSTSGSSQAYQTTNTHTLPSLSQGRIPALLRKWKKVGDTQTTRKLQWQYCCQLLGLQCSRLGPQRLPASAAQPKLSCIEDRRSFRASLLVSFVEGTVRYQHTLARTRAHIDARIFLRGTTMKSSYTGFLFLVVMSVTLMTDLCRL